PQVRIIAQLPLDEGVDLRFRLVAHRLDPEAFAVPTERLAIESGGARARIERLDEHGAGPDVALAADGREGAAQLRPADQRAHPDIRRKQQRLNPMWKPDRNGSALTWQHETHRLEGPYRNLAPRGGRGDRR